MSKSRLVRIVHGDTEKTVVLSANTPLEEVNDILHIIYRLDSKLAVVGLLTADGIVVPLSVACSSPDILPSTPCSLIVKDAAPSSTSSKEPEQINHVNEEKSEVDGVNINEVYSQVLNDISRFIYGLKNRDILSNKNARLLEDLLHDPSSTILYAAYSVATASNDAEYFAQICLQFAKILEHGNGRNLCMAQDELLQVCDQLYKNNKITEQKLLLLRHMILSFDANIQEVYNQFQSDNNVQLLAKSLYKLANHAGDDEDSNASEEKSTTISPNIVSSLGAIVGDMLSNGRITSSMASSLFDLIKQKNIYVIAAFELYEADGNVDELQDSLLRALSLYSRDDSLNHNDETVDEDHVDIESLMQTVGVENVWSKNVPRRFIILIFASVHRNFLTREQGICLCDLYDGDYDVVREAYQAYCENDDIQSFMDTIQGIVQGIDTDNASADSVQVNNMSSPIHAAKASLLKYALDLMLRRNMLSRKDCDSLLQQYESNQDELIESAIDSFNRDKDLEYLFDTLKVLAENPIENRKNILNAATSVPPPRHTPVSPSNVTTTSTSSVLTPSDQKSVIDVLDNGDQTVRDIFKQYEVNQDVQKLVHSIVNLDIVKAMANKDLSDDDEDEEEDVDDDSNTDESEDDEDDDDEEEEGEEEEEEEDNKLILELFQDITNELSLTPIEISALRLAIVTGNHDLQDAMKDFKRDFDALKLKKRLISISKSVVAETLAEKQYMNQDDDDDDESVSDADGRKEGDFNMEYEDYLRQAQAIVDESNKFDYTKYDDMSSNDENADTNDSESDSGSESDSESDDDNNDGEEAGVDHPTTARSARQQVFPILVAELIKEGIIQKGIGTKLLDMFNKGSDSVHSCLDKYDQTNDMAALIDNLQELLL